VGWVKSTRYKLSCNTEHARAHAPDCAANRSAHTIVRYMLVVAHSRAHMPLHSLF
jgi:hypothetical protein